MTSRGSVRWQWGGAPAGAAGSFFAFFGDSIKLAVDNGSACGLGLVGTIQGTAGSGGARGSYPGASRLRGDGALDVYP